MELGLRARAVTPSRWWRRVFGAKEGKRGSWMQTATSEEDAVTKCFAFWSHRTEQNDAGPPFAAWASFSFIDRTFMAPSSLMGSVRFGLGGKGEEGVRFGFERNESGRRRIDLKLKVNCFARQMGFLCFRDLAGGVER